jgi:hypothetical protein
MQKHINQAEQNLKLLEHLKEHHPDCFFDWKVTISFYISIHMLKALAIHRGKILGGTHQEIFNALNPKAAKKLFQIPDIQWKNYYNLYQYSRTARYDGFDDIEDHETIQKRNFEHCAVMLQYFITYVREAIQQPEVKPTKA